MRLYIFIFTFLIHFQAAFQNSDRRFYYVPCLHCSEIATTT